MPRLNIITSRFKGPLILFAAARAVRSWWGTSVMASQSAFVDVQREILERTAMVVVILMIIPPFVSTRHLSFSKSV